jgi:hypothetical protein
MRRTILLLCLCIVAPALSGFGQSTTPQIPHIISAGFDSYRMAGAGEAMRVWVHGGPLEGTPDAEKQEKILFATQGIYGPWRGFSVVATRDVSASTRIVYLTIDYEKGPLFAKFLMFHSQPGWIVSSLVFDTEENDVLPPQ